MSLDIPLFKLVDRPLLPIGGSWVDATPVLAMFFLLLIATGAALRLRGRPQQIARRGLQLFAAFIFIVFLHRCLCMLRGWAFALQLVGRNNILAFGHVCMFIVIFAVAMSFGRFFCGWICPMHLLQEIFGKVSGRRLRLPSKRARTWAGYLTLAGVITVVFALAHLVRPGVNFFVENVAAVWGMVLLMLLVLVLARERFDVPLKRLKYYSAGLWLALSMAGVFVTNSWCVLFGNEVDYSSIVAFVAVISAGLVVAMAWCRYLCPAGGVLAAASHAARYRIGNSDSCKHCGECDDICPMGALRDGKVDGASCTYCGRCLEHCGLHWQVGPSTKASADDGEVSHA